MGSHNDGMDSGDLPRLKSGGIVHKDVNSLITRFF
jgi:hypothetical protein